MVDREVMKMQDRLVFSENVPVSLHVEFTTILCTEIVSVYAKCGVYLFVCKHKWDLDVDLINSRLKHIQYFA